MKKSTKIALFSVVLTGCSTVSMNIENGNYSFLTNDVSVTPYGSNYMIQTMMQIGDDRSVIKVTAVDCENGYGRLQTKSGDIDVAKNGSKKVDDVFRKICAKGLPIAYSMNSKLSDSDKQKRDQAAQQSVSNMLAPKPRRARPSTNPADVTCVTTRYNGGAYTDCK